MKPERRETEVWLSGQMRDGSKLRVDIGGVLWAKIYMLWARRLFHSRHGEDRNTDKTCIDSHARAWAQPRDEVYDQSRRRPTQSPATLTTDMDNRFSIGVQL